MLLYVLLVATLNMSVGFAVAEALGRGPRWPSLRSLWEWSRYFTWYAWDRSIHFRCRFERPLAKRPQIKAPAAERPPAEATPTAEPSAETNDVGESLDSTADDQASESPPADEQTTSETASFEDSVAEASVDDLMAGLMQFRDRIASLDTKVRDCVRKPETREIQKCVDEFKQANGDYLAESNRIAEQLDQQPSASSAADLSITSALSALEIQVEKVRSAQQILEQLDPDADPAALCEEVQSLVKQVIESSDTLKAELDQWTSGSADRPLKSADLEQFMSGLMAFRQEIKQIDTQVRRCVEAPDAGEMQECVDHFKQANQSYLARSGALRDHLERMRDRAGSSDALRNKMQQAVEEQANEIEKASRTLEHIDVERDLEASCQAMLAQSGDVMAASSKLNDELIDARIEIAKEKGLPIDDDELLTDALTKLPSRIALERVIDEYRISSGTPSLAMALVDVDRLGELNREHGTALGDRVLCSVARLLEQDANENQIVSRFEGRRFALLFRGQKAADVCNSVERQRQQLEAVTFRVNCESISITVSCSIANLHEGEEVNVCYERLEAALGEAKRFGRNRTFKHDGRSPAPVVPPELTIEPLEIEA